MCSLNATEERKMTAPYNTRTAYYNESVQALNKAGIAINDAIALRRISMTLHRWHELECGNDNGFASYCVTRGRKENGSFEYDDNGAPYIESHPYSSNKASYTRIPDRERGALKRLAKIMAGYPTMQAYVQGDPRGASLYIIRDGDVPEGQDVGSYYNRGIAVYK
jgi:hypothetical protein